MPPRKRGRGGGNTGASSSNPPAVASDPDFPEVIFANEAQKEVFLKLKGVNMLSTRFLHLDSMRYLGLSDTLKDLFTGTGLPFLLGMNELSYKSLTLEFLSSFAINKSKTAVCFRLQNYEHNYTLEDFGILLGMVYNMDVELPELELGSLWKCISGKTWDGSHTAKLRTNDIPHPGLRLWARTVIGTIFARNEKGTMTLVELRLLGYYLTYRHLAASPMNLPLLVAQHFYRVAHGNHKTIEVGGLVTLLAKKLSNFDGTDCVPLSTEVPLINTNYLMANHKWINMVVERGTRYHWRISSRRFIKLPCDDLPTFEALPAPAPGVVRPLYSLASFPMESGEPDDADAPDVAMDEDTIPPDYTVAPSMRPPAPSPYMNYTNPSFPNYQVIQGIHQDMAHYGHHHYMVQQGLLPPDGPHPAFYHGPGGPYGGYPGGIFTDRGFDPANWGPSYWGTSSTHGGHEHDDDGDDDDDDGN